MLSTLVKVFRKKTVQITLSYKLRITLIAGIFYYSSGSRAVHI